jgi:hypothetical protein
MSEISQYISTKLAQHSKTFIGNGVRWAGIEKSNIVGMGGARIKDYKSRTAN